MKKIIVTALSVLFALLMLVSCSQKESYVFTPEVLVAQGENEQEQIGFNSHVTITEGAYSSRAFGSDEVYVNDGTFSLCGVKIGDSWEKFAQSFMLKSGEAMWETCLYVTDEEIIFNYPAYDGAALSFGKYDDAFLTVGYSDRKDSDQWNTMTAEVLKNTWNIEQNYEFDGICIISAGLDENGIINQIDVDYGSQEEFNEKENYRTAVDYFAMEEESYSKLDTEPVEE